MPLNLFMSRVVIFSQKMPPPPFFKHRVLLCSSGWSITHSVDQTSLSSSCLPSTRIKSVPTNFQKTFSSLIRRLWNIVMLKKQLCSGTVSLWVLIHKKLCLLFMSCIFASDIYLKRKRSMMKSVVLINLATNEVTEWCNCPKVRLTVGITILKCWFAG